MYIYTQDNKIMAATATLKDFSHLGWTAEETDEEIIQVLGQLYRKSEAAEILAEQATLEEIRDLKSFLAATDYAIIKIAEGEATPEQYAEVIAQRKAARERINELENMEENEG